MYKRLSSILLVVGMAAPAAAQVELPNEFEAGEPASAEAVNANFEALESAVNDNAARLTELEPADDQAPPLAFELSGGPLIPLRGAENGGVERPPGGSSQPLSLVICGLPGPLSEPIRMLEEDRRISGRVLRLSDSMGTALISLTSTHIKALGVPAVGPVAENPFEVSLIFDENSGNAELGPFGSEQVTPPTRGSVFQPGLELSIDNVGSSVFTLQSIEAVRVFRPPGGSLDADSVIIRVASADAGALINAYTRDRRLANPTLRYLGPDGSTVLEITADTGRFISAAPDLTGNGVAVELEFDSNVDVSAP